jgi:sulfide:quinone oxidoreductase
MKPEDVTFELKPVYERMGITHEQAKAVAIHPEGTPAPRPPMSRPSAQSPARLASAWT